MKFEIEGYGIENLLVTLHRKKIAVFNLKKTDRKLAEFEVRDKDSKRVKRLIANFKVKTTLSRFKAVPKFILANVGVLIGLVLGVLFGIFASTHTWQILVYGTKDLTVTEILKVLEENGIKKGKINLETSEEIEEILLNKYDRIAQISVVRKGTAIIINLSEKLVYDEIEFEPITAKHSGIIKKINVVTGTVNTKVGDFVNVGDALVLPFNINADGQKVSVKPIAEIVAEMFIIGKCEIKREENVLMRTGRVARVYQYKLGNLNLFSGKNKNSFADFEFEVYNENVSNVVPLNRDVYVYYELAPKVVVHNFETEQEKLLEKSRKLALKSAPIGEILNEQSEIKQEYETLFAITTLTLIGNIND